MTIALVHIFSLPVVWFLIPRLMTYWTYLEFALVAEGFAVISEGALTKAPLRIPWWRSFATSAAMNMTSFAFGILFSSIVF